MKEQRRRLPPFVLNRAGDLEARRALKVRLRKARLHTVCESARCPNLGECFSRPTAAFMILGNRCSRGCGFCAVERGRGLPVDPEEPERVAEAAAELGLRHVVITSVTRDDLPDGGAAHFAAVVRAVRKRLPSARVEVLTPDFQGREQSLHTVLYARPDVFNHNLETVPRLYEKVRPAADYGRSLNLIRTAARMSRELAPGLLVKSGLMVGLGESKEEVLAVLSDLAAAGCHAVTIGQYLQPRRDRLPVVRYWSPEEYEELKETGERLGLLVFAGPLVRSSYLADQLFEELDLTRR